MSTKRLITALDLPGIKPGTPPTRTPEVTWIDPSELLVDESYQRGVGEKGLRLIRRIVETFDWRRFKPPTAVWTDRGLEVVDGQHSAIAAATHPEVKTIPVVVVEGAEISDRAAAFIGINKDRLGVTPMQIHAAGVVAGDEAAMQIEQVCNAAGVRILKSSPSNGEYRPRDTVAVRAIGNLIRRRGVDVAGEVMKVVCASEPAPVTANAVRAVDFLMHDAEHAEAFDRPDLVKAMVALGQDADREAGVFAAEHCVPKWRGLAATWFRKTRRRKPRAEAAGDDEPSEPAPRSGQEATSLEATDGKGRAPLPALVDSVLAPPSLPNAKRGKVIYRRPRPGETWNFGDPAPGRSALDQERAKAAAR